MPDPLLPNEALRLQALLDYEILDTEPETAFDDLTRLAAMICQTPTAFISLVDASRQWFKSRIGFGFSETHRDYAFCSHTILEPDEVFVVEDAAADQRFRTNPLVTDEPRIRFYAGAPLVLPNGFVLGSLSVIDYVPRRLSAEQLETLKALARQVVSQLELRRAIRANSKLSEHARQIFEQATDGIHLYDFEGRIISANQKFCELTGRSEKELLTMRVQDLLPPEELVSRPILFDRFREGQTLVSERRIMRPDGSFLLIEVSGKMIGGQTILGIARDISERKRIEQELLDTERRFRDFVNSSLAFFCTHDLKGTIQSVSPAVTAALGYAESEIVGQNFDSFLLPEARPSFPHYLKQLETVGESRGFMWILTKTGERRIWSYCNVVRADSNGTEYVLGSAQDVTELKQKEEELRRAHDAALESARLKSAFLTNVSHEIRTPMNGIIGMTELLLDTPLDRDQREYAQTIKHSADALLIVINDILDLSKIESGKLRFETLDFNPYEVVESTVELLAGQAFRKNIEITSLVETGIPAVLRGDPGRLRQVLTNLIGNAIKFTEQGGVRVEVSAEEETAEHLKLRFDIKDTGIGIDKQKLKNLFQPFVQVDDSYTRKYGGTGLGLVISKQIVEMFDGEITVETEPGQGSCFSFTAIFAKKESDVKSVAKNTDETAAQLAQKRILIADASEIIRQNLEEYSRSRKLIPVSVANGADVLQKMHEAADRGRPFDLAVIDLNLPDWDGFSLANCIKTDKAISSTQIIVTTAYGQRGDASKARENGVAGYLTKPVRHAQFLECLAEVAAQNSQPAVTDAPSPDLVTRHSLSEARAENENPVVLKDGKTFRVLVVEDNQINRQVVLGQLSKIGIKADFAVDGVDALEKISNSDYELVFMDCQMPRLDGYQTTREIRRLEELRKAFGESFTPLKIVALTAHTLAGERERCLAVGMDDFLTKPVKSYELATIIKFWKERAENPETEALLDTLNEDLPKEIINLFFTETTARLDEIKQALATGESQKIARLAHAVRGNALAVGAVKLAATAASIESFGIENKTKETSAGFQKITNEFRLLSSKYQR